MSTSDAASHAVGRLFGLLRVAFDQATEDVLAHVAPAHPALRPAHLMIFRFGGIDGSHAAELAAHAGITKQSMHEVITHLERHGYLRRISTPKAPRARVVELTAEGRALEQQVHDAISVVVEAWAERIGRDRLDNLWESLEEITGEPAAPTTTLRSTPDRTPDRRSGG